MLAAYASARLVGIHTTQAAWKTFVGSSTPREFLMYAQSEDPRQAVAEYVEELPAAMGHEYSNEERDAITDMLYEYVRDTRAGVGVSPGVGRRTSA